MFLPTTICYSCAGKGVVARGAINVWKHPIKCRACDGVGEIDLHPETRASLTKEQAYNHVNNQSMITVQVEV